MQPTAPEVECTAVVDQSLTPPAHCFLLFLAELQVAPDQNTVIIMTTYLMKTIATFMLIINVFLHVEEDGSMEQKTWQVYCSGIRNTLI